jgi:hypothetical protein
LTVQQFTGHGVTLKRMTLAFFIVSICNDLADKFGFLSKSFGNGQDVVGGAAS